MPVFQIRLLLSMEYSEVRVMVKVSELRWHLNLIGSHPDSLSYELMGKDKLNWKKPRYNWLLEKKKDGLTEFAS